MQSPQKPSANSQPVSSDTNSDPNLTEEPDFEQALAAVEQALQEIKDRYNQVQQDQQTQVHLLEQRDGLQQQLRQTPTPALKAELKQVQEKLTDLEFSLESRLFSFGSLKEAFWQIVRFGGLGVVIGWSLAFCTMQPPKPPVPASVDRPMLQNN